MGLFKNRLNSSNKDIAHQNNKKEVKYVYLYSRKAVFLITGQPRKNKYSYGVPIIPLHGIYYSSKDKHKYTAKELSEYYVVLNIDAEDADVLRGKKVVVLGYDDNEMLVITDNGGDDDGSNKA